MNIQVLDQKIEGFLRSESSKTKFKDLNFQKITEIADEAFHCFSQFQKRADSLSLKARIEPYQELSTSLKKIARHIHRSKSLWQKFLSLFTYLSGDEKKFQNVARAAKKALNHSKSRHRRVWAGESALQRILNFFGLSPKFSVKDTLDELQKNPERKIRAAAFRILGENRVQSRQFEGESVYIAIKNIQKDIKNFLRLTKPHLTKNQETRLQSMQQHLAKARSYALDLRVIAYLRGKKTGSNHRERIKEMCHTFRADMEKLAPGENMIIPGGYKSKIGGHAVVFEILREQKGTYQFRIINTGNGADHFDTPSTGTEHTSSTQAFDYYISGLSIDDVGNEEFWSKMLELNLDDNGSVGKMLGTIVKHLAKSNTSAIKKGEPHWIQTNGTCAHDSIICWMESQMDPLLFEGLLLHMTKSGLDRLNDTRFLSKAKKNIKSLKARISGTTVQGAHLLTKIREFGRATLQKRKSHLSETRKVEKKERSILEAQIEEAAGKFQAKKEQLGTLERKPSQEDQASREEEKSRLEELNQRLKGSKQINALCATK